ADAGLIACVLEGALIVAKECIFLIGERINEDVGPTVVVVIGEVGAHACENFAILIISKPYVEGDLGECTVAVVVEKLLGEGVVGDEDVRPAIPIEVANDSLARSEEHTSELQS